jgi:proline iminopeptidase
MRPASTGPLVYVSGMGTPTWWREGGRPSSEPQARRLSKADQERLGHLAQIDRTAAEEVEFRRLSWALDFTHNVAAPAALEEMATAPTWINWKVNRALARAELLGEVQLLAACERCEVLPRAVDVAYPSG